MSTFADFDHFQSILTVFRHQFFENIKKGVLMVPKFLTPDARDFLLKVRISKQVESSKQLLLFKL